MPVNPEALAAGLAQLGKLRPGELEIERLLDEVVGAANVLFDLSGAGFLMIDAHNALRSVAASDHAGAVLERVQQEEGEGPCVDAFVTDVTTVCNDLATDPRYRKVGPLLAAEGIGSVLGVPIRLGGGPIGSLNVYCVETREWSDEERGALETYGRLLTGMLGAALVAEQRGELAEQLQFALDHRIVIERAIGFLMSELQMGQVEAFDHLRRSARDRRRRVADVAREVLDRRSLPPRPG